MELFGEAVQGSQSNLGRREGMIELANGGTLLLDEVGELPMETQTRLLRFLQTQRIGNVEANVRLLATTSRQLETKVQQGQASMEQRRARLVDILAAEHDIGVSTLANRLNASRTTIYSDLDALCQDGLVRKNGNGWEVTN